MSTELRFIKAGYRHHDQRSELSTLYSAVRRDHALLWSLDLNLLPGQDGECSRAAFDAYDPPHDPATYLPAWTPQERTEAAVYHVVGDGQRLETRPLPDHLTRLTRICGDEAAHQWALWHNAERQLDQAGRHAALLGALHLALGHRGLKAPGVFHADTLRLHLAQWTLTQYLPPAALDLEREMVRRGTLQPGQTAAVLSARLPAEAAHLNPWARL